MTGTRELSLILWGVSQGRLEHEVRVVRTSQNNPYWLFFYSTTKQVEYTF